MLTLNELWKVIPGCPDYEVSSQGRVRRVTPWCNRNRRSKNPVLNADLSGSGYQRVTLCRNGKRNRFLVHRLVLTAFVGDPHPGMHGNHKNGVKGDDRLENLEWVTPSENGLHAYEKGLSRAGEMHHNAKLTDWQVRVIRRLPRRGQREIAAIFGTNQPTVSEIQRGISRCGYLVA